jgi:hypothetical protein
MPSPLGEGQTDMPIAQANQGEVKRTRRSIVTIRVRSLTMQAWDRGNAGMHSEAP